MADQKKKEGIMPKLERWWAKVTDSRVLTIFGAFVIGLATWMLVSPSVGAASYTGVPISDFNALESEILSLQSRVNMLEGRVASLPNASYPYYPPTTGYTPGVPNTGGSGASPVVTYGPVAIDQNGGQYNANWDIYFTGRGFAPSEPILISENGVVVGHAIADAGGNLASRGIMLTAGRHVYQFSGQTSGVTSVASVTGIRLGY